MDNWLKQTTLIGKNVKLIPLKMEHKAALLEAAADGELWNIWVTSVPSSDSIDAYISKALADYDQQKALPFAIVEQMTGTIIGSTRFCSAFSEFRRIEVGYTWYAKRFQKTGINTECKYLMLQHAFETLNTIAVELKTHFFNQNSRQAIERLGARMDGILRNHRIDKNGVIRDTVVYSIIESEWGAVKFNLEQRMKRGVIYPK